MSNETITVNNTIFLMIPQGEDHEKEPWFKCACGVIIKQEKNLFKHTLTKSHGTNLINRPFFAVPNESLLRPGLVFPKP